MKAMILAAGFGKRLRPFTLVKPKPLLKVGPETLLERHLRRLAVAGIQEVVINVAYLGHMIEDVIQDGASYGVQVQYSREPLNEPLETGGAVREILPWFDDKPFLLIAADIWTDFLWCELHAKFEFLRDQKEIDAYLGLVPTPDWLAKQDFYWDSTDHMVAQSNTVGTQQGVGYAGFGVFHPRLWQGANKSHFPLSDVLIPGIVQQRIKGFMYQGPWFNIGSYQRLTECENYLMRSSNWVY